MVKAGRIEIVAFCGRQGVPRMPGLGSEIRDSAHALAMGKVVLVAAGAQRAGALRRARAHRVHARTRSSRPSTSPPSSNRSERDGYAVDREEFDENFCCIAAPIFDARGRFVAALGLSMTANVFDADRDALAPIVVDVARSAATAPPTAAGGRPAPGAPPRLGEPRRLAPVS